MGRVSKAVVDSAALRISQLDASAWVEMLDGLSESQPKPTGFVIALSRMGLPESELDHVLHVLLVIAECYRRIAREGLPQITDEMLEASAKRINAMGRLLEGESDETEWTTGLIVEEHPERDLFVYIMNYLDEQGLTRPNRMHKHAVFSAAVVLDVFMQAASQAGGSAE